MSDATPLSVYTYLDYHQLLQAWWDREKLTRDRELTYQSFADDAGCTRAAVHNVINGKRLLSEEMAFSFADAMRLDEEETEFFVTLVSFKNARQHARDAKERDRRWEHQQQERRAWKIITSRRGYREAALIDLLAGEYLSHWYYPAIRELALLPDFRNDPAWIARTLDPRIRPEQAAEALDTLLKLGLLVADEGGGLRATTAGLSTRDEVSALAVRDLYDQVFRVLSPRAIDAFGGEERELGLSIVAPPPELIPEIKRRMTQFRGEIARMCDAAMSGQPSDAVAEASPDLPACSPARQIFLLSLQFFPLSLPADAPPGFRRGGL